jgi:hypothetical protein
VARRFVQAIVPILAFSIACSGGDGIGSPLPAGPVPGADVLTPFPIDRGDDGAHTPGSYKGLPLRLSDNGKPTVTAVDGIVGLVCVGMSNASQECADFISRVRTDYAGEVRP